MPKLGRVGSVLARTSLSMTKALKTVIATGL